jgi:RNA polymerase sigma factor (sigma-70 family)
MQWSELTEKLFCRRHTPRDSKQFQAALEQEIATLTSKQQRVLELREDLTHEEVAQQLGTTKGAIRQIEAKAIRMLRHPRRRLFEL